jgi:hypothetical protein
MKPLALAFRPDTIPEISQFFDYAVVPIYVDSDFDEIKSLIDNELKNYKIIIAIDDNYQANRIELVKEVDSWDRVEIIELDEQIDRNTLTIEELEEIKKYSSKKTAITSVFASMNHFLSLGGNPDYLFVEYSNESDIINLRKYRKPIWAIYNFATDKDRGKMMVDIRKGYYLSDGLWLWGWHTDHPDFEEKALRNLDVIQILVKEFKSVSFNPAVLLIPLGLFGLLFKE